MTLTSFKIDHAIEFVSTADGKRSYQVEIRLVEEPDTASIEGIVLVLVGGDGRRHRFGTMSDLTSHALVDEKDRYHLLHDLLARGFRLSERDVAALTEEWNRKWEVYLSSRRAAPPPTVERDVVKGHLRRLSRALASPGAEQDSESRSSTQATSRSTASRPASP